MKAPRAQGKNLKIRPPRGLGGYPKFFFTLNLILFVSINSVQNFKTVALPLLGEKFVVVVVVVVGGVETYFSVQLRPRPS